MDSASSCLCDSSDPTEYLETLKKKYLARTAKLQSQQRELERKIMKMEAFIGKGEENESSGVPKVFPETPVRDVQGIPKTMTQNQQPVSQQCSFFQKMMDNAMSILSMKCQCPSTVAKSIGTTPGATTTETTTSTPLPPSITIATDVTTSDEPPTKDLDYSTQENVVDYEGTLTDKSSRTSTCTCDFTDPSTLQDFSCTCNIGDAKTKARSQQVSIEASSSTPQSKAPGDGTITTSASKSKSEKCPWKKSETSELISGECSCDVCACDSTFTFEGSKGPDLEHVMPPETQALPAVSVFLDKGDSPDAEIQAKASTASKSQQMAQSTASKCVTCCQNTSCKNYKSQSETVAKTQNLSSGIQVASHTKSRGINSQMPKNASNIGVSCCQIQSCPINNQLKACKAKCNTPTVQDKPAGPDMMLRAQDEVIQVRIERSDLETANNFQKQDGQNQCAFVGSPLLDFAQQRAETKGKKSCDCNTRQGPKTVCQASGYSLTSNDIQEMQNIADLAKKEKQMKTQIQELQRREKQYQEATRNVETLVNKASNDQCCHCHNKSNVNSEIEKITRDLKLENQTLKSELMDMKIELRHCLEKIEGPMKQKLETEKLKCENLQRDLQTASKNMLMNQDTYAREMNQLKLQLCCACTNITELNQMNNRLKEEMSQLDCLCQKLEDDLLKQKVDEAETIKRLTARKMSSSKTTKQEEFKCDSNLDMIARKLSRTIKDLGPCEECSKLPSELAGAAKCIKELTDMVRKRRPKGSPSGSCSCQKPVSRTFSQSEECCSCCGPREGAGESPQEKTVKTILQVPKSFAKNEESSKFDVAAAQSSYYSAKGEPAREPPCAHIGTPCLESKGTTTIPEEVPCGDIGQPCSKPVKDTTVQVPFAVDKGCRAPCSDMIEKVDLKPSEPLQEPKMTSTSSDKRHISQLARGIVDQLPTEIEADVITKTDSSVPESSLQVTELTSSPTTEATLPEELTSGVSGEGSREGVKELPRDDSKELKSKEELPIEVEEIQPELVEPQPVVDVEESEQALRSEPLDTVLEHTAEVDDEDEEEAKEHKVKIGEREIPFEEKRYGGEMPYDVENKAFGIGESPDLHMTTTITDSGTLEVITEGPGGIIETKLTYTEEGNIEVVTEMSDRPEDVASASAAENMQDKFATQPPPGGASFFPSEPSSKICPPGVTCHSMEPIPGYQVCPPTSACSQMSSKAKSPLRPLPAGSSTISGPSGPEAETPFTPSVVTAEGDLTSKLGSSSSGVKPKLDKTPDLTSGYAKSSEIEAQQYGEGAEATLMAGITDVGAEKAFGIEPGYSREAAAAKASSSIERGKEAGKAPTELGRRVLSGDLIIEVETFSEEPITPASPKKSLSTDLQPVVSDLAKDSKIKPSESTSEHRPAEVLSEEMTSTAGELRSGEVFTPEEAVSDLEDALAVADSKIGAGESPPTALSEPKIDSVSLTMKLSDMKGGISDEYEDITAVKVKESLRAQEGALEGQMELETELKPEDLEKIESEIAPGEEKEEQEGLELEIEAVPPAEGPQEAEELKEEEIAYEEKPLPAEISAASQIVEPKAEEVFEEAVEEIPSPGEGDVAPVPGPAGFRAARDCACQSKDQTDQSCQCCECKTVGVSTSGDKETITENQIEDEEMGKAPHEPLDGAKTDTDSEFLTISETTDNALAHVPSEPQPPGDIHEEEEEEKKAASSTVSAGMEGDRQQQLSEPKIRVESESQRSGDFNIIAKEITITPELLKRYPQLAELSETSRQKALRELGYQPSIDEKLSDKRSDLKRKQRPREEDEEKEIEADDEMTTKHSKQVGKLIKKQKPGEEDEDQEVEVDDEMISKHPELVGKLVKKQRPREEDEDQEVEVDDEMISKHPELVGQTKSQQQQLLRKLGYGKPVGVSQKSAEALSELEQRKVDYSTPKPSSVEVQGRRSIEKTVSFRDSKDIVERHPELAGKSAEEQKKMLAALGYDASVISSKKSSVEAQQAIPEAVGDELMDKASAISKQKTRSQIVTDAEDKVVPKKASSKISKEIYEKYPELVGKSSEEQEKIIKDLNIKLPQMQLRRGEGEAEVFKPEISQVQLSPKILEAHPELAGKSLEQQKELLQQMGYILDDVFEEVVSSAKFESAKSSGEGLQHLETPQPSSKDVSVTCKAPCRSAATIHTAATPKESEKDIIEIGDVSLSSISKSRTVSLQQKPSSRDDSASCKASCRTISVQSSGTRKAANKEVKEIIAARTESTTTTTSTSSGSRKKDKSKCESEVPSIVSQLSDRERPRVETAKRARTTKKRRPRVIDCMKCSCRDQCDCAVCTPERNNKIKRPVKSCDCPPNIFMMAPPMQMTYSMPPTGHAPNCKCNACLCKDLPKVESPTSDETDGQTKKLKKHPSNCECVDCLCLPKVKKLARTKEYPVVKDAKQVYQVKVKCDTCANAQNARRYMEQQQQQQQSQQQLNRSRIPISTTTANPPRVRSEIPPKEEEAKSEEPPKEQVNPLTAVESTYNSVACDCSQCICSDCPDEAKQQKPVDKQPSAIAAKPSERVARTSPSVKINIDEKKGCCCGENPCVCQPCAVEELKQKLKEAEDKLAAANLQQGVRSTEMPVAPSAKPQEVEEECTCLECVCPQSDLMTSQVVGKIPSAVKPPPSAQPSMTAKPPAGGGDDDEPCTCVECVCPGAEDELPKVPSSAVPPPASAKPSATRPAGDQPSHPEECNCPECVCPGIEDFKQGDSAVQKQPSAFAPPAGGPLQTCDCTVCKCAPCADPQKQGTPIGDQPSQIIQPGVADCDCVDCKCDPCADPKKKQVKSQVKVVPSVPGAPLEDCDCTTCECPGIETEKLQAVTSFPEKASQILAQAQQHPEDCTCPVCTCPGGPEPQLPPVASKTSKFTDMPEKIPHPPDCDCTECLCLEEIVQTEFVDQTEKGVQPVGEKEVHALDCCCPECFCVECSTKETHAAGCKCPECTCEPCDKMDAQKEAGDQKAAPVKSVEFHPADCTCIRCVCDVCSDPSKKTEATPKEVMERKLEGPEVELHGDGCKCVECLCKECLMKLTPLKHDEGCQCVQCVCVDCLKKMQQGDQPIASSASRTAGKERALGDEKGPNCTCAHCLCIDCKGTAAQAAPVTPKPSQMQRSEPVGAHGDQCSCQDCQCKPCFTKETKQGDCTCPNCTCVECTGKKQQEGQEMTQIVQGRSLAGDEHGAECTCAVCECKPCFSKVQPEEECTCKVCECVSCSKKRAEGADALATGDKPAHSPTCTCPVCECGPGGAAQAGPAAEIQGPSMPGAASEHAALLMDPPPFEPFQRIDCNCPPKCDCVICLTQAAAAARFAGGLAGVEIGVGKSVHDFPDDYVPPPFEVPVRIDCICNRCSCIFCNKEGPLKRSIGAQPSIADQPAMRKAVSAQQSALIQIQGPGQSTTLQPGQSSVHQADCLCELCACIPCQQDMTKSAGVLPSQQAVLASQQAMLQSQQAILASQRDLAKSTGVLPSQQAVLASQQAVLPSQQAILASQRDLARSAGVLPSQQAVMASQQAVLPSQHAVPVVSFHGVPAVSASSQAAVLASQRDLAKSAGVLPSQQAVLASQQAILASQRDLARSAGVLPSQQAVLASQQTMLPSQQAVLASQQAMLASQHAVPAVSFHGVPVSSQIQGLHPQGCNCQKCLCNPCKLTELATAESFVSAKGAPSRGAKSGEAMKTTDAPVHCNCPTCTCEEGVLRSTMLDKPSLQRAAVPSATLQASCSTHGPTSVLQMQQSVHGGPTSAVQMQRSALAQKSATGEVYLSAETLVLPKPDVRQMYPDHPPTCNCAQCKCVPCADPNMMTATVAARSCSELKSGTNIKESVRAMDNVALVRSIQAANKENCECKEQIEEIKRTLERIKCACTEAEFRSTQSMAQTMGKEMEGFGGNKPFVKKASVFGQTMSGLKMALNNLQAKCKAKDRMIEAMTTELDQRGPAEVFDRVLDMSMKIPNALDYDQAEDVNSLFRSQLTTNIIYAPPEVRDESTAACDLRCVASKGVEVRTHKHKKKTKGSNDKAGNKDDCECSKPQIIQKEEKDCQKLDLGGFEVIDIRRITDDSLIVKWNAPKNDQVQGYDIFVNGTLATKVMSGTRTSAMMHSLDLSKSVQITIYAVTKCGRVEPPAIAIYEIKS